MLEACRGISKAIPKDNNYIFVGLESHLQNTCTITRCFSNHFVSKKELLCKAASCHDLLKAQNINPNALNGKQSLFPRHAQLPDYMLDPAFNEFELDPERRVENWNNYYVLNLVRLHHSGFNYYQLFNKGGFLYETGNPQEAFQNFVTDWYALMTADWLDSRIIECIFHAREIPSLVDLGVHSEVDLQVLGENSFRIVQEGILISRAKLSYDYVVASREKINEILRVKKKREKKSALLDYLNKLEIKSQKVQLIES